MNIFLIFEDRVQNLNSWISSTARSWHEKIISSRIALCISKLELSKTITNWKEEDKLNCNTFNQPSDTSIIGTKLGYKCNMRSKRTTYCIAVTIKQKEHTWVEADWKRHRCPNDQKTHSFRRFEDGREDCHASIIHPVSLNFITGD